MEVFRRGLVWALAVLGFAVLIGMAVLPLAGIPAAERAAVLRALGL